MSLVDSSSDDDCYVNSAKALQAMKKKLAITRSPIDQERPPSPKDSIPPYMLDECTFVEPPPAPKPKSSARGRGRGRSTSRSRRRTRRNVNYADEEDTENMPELFAKKKPVQSISLIDSDPDDSMISTVPDDLDTTMDEADQNYEITIKINWQSARIERLPLRRYQEFSTVFKHFSDLENIPQEKIWLVFRNQITIQPTDTPDSLGLSIVDIIEGGIIDVNQSEHQQTVNTNIDKDSIIVKIQTKDQKKALAISIKKTQKMKVLIMKCAEQLQIPEEKIKFEFDGDPVYPNETPESLDLEGGECFDMHTIP